MWLDNLKELRKQKGNPTYKKIGEDANLPERTIARVFSGDTKNPYATTLDLIARALGSSLEEVLADTKVVVGSEKMSVLQNTVDTLTAEYEAVIAERDILTAENVVLKDKVVNLTAEVDLLRLKLEHKEEIINLHNFYIKRG